MSNGEFEVEIRCPFDHAFTEVTLPSFAQAKATSLCLTKRLLWTDLVDYVEIEVEANGYPLTGENKTTVQC